MKNRLPATKALSDVDIPKAYATGKHLLLVKTNETHWQAIGFVNGNVIRHAAETQGELIVSFARFYGKPDSTKTFQSSEEAHAALPKFFNKIPNGNLAAPTRKC